MFLLARLMFTASVILIGSVAVSAQGDLYKLPNKPAGSERRTPSGRAFLTNESILSLVEAELSEEVIIRKIKASECRFDVSPDAIAELKHQGVTKLVLEEMINVSTPAPSIPASERPSSPIGAKFYIAPMPDGLTDSFRPRC
jgi:hypothetical protein